VIVSDFELRISDLYPILLNVLQLVRLEKHDISPAFARLLSIYGLAIPPAPPVVSVCHNNISGPAKPVPLYGRNPSAPTFQQLFRVIISIGPTYIGRIIFFSEAL